MWRYEYMKKLAQSIRDFILGKRPHNTIFSFNYHNIRHIVRFLQREIAALPDKQYRILDVGGGASPYHGLFKGKTAEYIVVDVENALAEDDARGASFIKGFAEELPFPDDSFDIVMSNQVLEHVNSEHKAVAESYRVLKPGGIFIGSAPHVSPIHLEPYDFRRFTVLGLRKIIEEHKFRHITIEGNGGVHRAAALMVLMDWNLSPYTAGHSQRFYTRKHLLLFPLTGIINTIAIIMDAVMGDKQRSPSNYCWKAEKPSMQP